MLSKIKDYLKNNYQNNVKPFLEKPKGKLALKWSVLSAVFYTAMCATIAFIPETPPSQQELSVGATFALIAMTVTLLGGMISTSVIGEKLLFLSGQTSKHYEKVKLAFSALLTAACLYSDSTNFMLIYIIPILTMVGAVGVMDSITKLLKMKIEGTTEDEKENAVLDLLSKDQTIDPQLKKKQEEMEVEQELGLTNYFTKK